MIELLRQAPIIIQEAAKSPLGLFALMIMSLSILGFVFFRSSTERTRIAMFVVMFIGVSAFGASAVRTTTNTVTTGVKSDIPSALPSPNQRNINGKWIGRITEADGYAWKILFEFDVREGQVSGIVTYPTGGGEIADGKLVDDKLSFTTKLIPQFETEVATTRFTGKVSDETINFTMQSSSVLRKFSAARISK